MQPKHSTNTPADSENTALQNGPVTSSELNKPVVLQEDPKKEGIKSALSTLTIIIMAFVTAFLLITYVFQYYQVDGQSMETTLQNGDRLVVWKVPRTVARITKHPYIPDRGDIVIFSESGLNSYDQSGTQQLIKRVIALPGERVVVRNGSITVYNKENPNGFSPDKTMDYTDVIGYSDGDGDYTLGKNELFVCGDNRGNSRDSRYFGPIEADHIVGKLVFRILPLSNAETF